jgi:YD repeat-containing protein
LAPATEAPLAASFASDIEFPAPGLDLVVSRQYAQTIAGRYALGPFGRGWTHTWDMSAVTDADGNVTINTPAGARRFTRQPDGSFRGEAGDPASLVLVGGIDPCILTGDGTIFEFHADGRLKYVEDANGNRITASYTDGLLTALVHSGGGQLTIGYDISGRISQITRPDGHEITYTYDALGEHLLNVAGEHGATIYAYSTGQSPQSPIPAASTRSLSTTVRGGWPNGGSRGAPTLMTTSRTSTSTPAPCALPTPPAVVARSFWTTTGLRQSSLVPIRASCSSTDWIRHKTLAGQRC